MTYNYLASNYTPSGATTNLVSSINYNGASSLSYTYYSTGYIHTVSDGANTIHYKYDGIGQLLQTDDPTDTRGGANGSVWVNVYDVGGNITSKKLYSYDSNNEDLTDNTLVHTYTYTYDTTWKDKLASFDGNTITTDAIGNTTGYNGWTYTWEAGRQLEQMSNGSTTLQFKYNDAGLRTQKINGATTTKYYWAGSSISHMTSGSDTLHFWYDAAGIPTMVTYNGTNYYYKHNLQGDIIGLIDMTGTSVVAYTYDSWGKQLSCTGTLANTLGAVNPLRYRGYIFDNETGLYYLQNRYFNPDWGRFINADSNVSTDQILNSANMFLYCNNQSILLVDQQGTKAAVGTMLAVVTIGFVALGIAVCGLMVINNNKPIYVSLPVQFNTALIDAVWGQYFDIPRVRVRTKVREKAEEIAIAKDAYFKKKIMNCIILLL